MQFIQNKQEQKSLIITQISSWSVMLNKGLDKRLNKKIGRTG